MLTNRLDASDAATFAKCCKSLRGVQTPADRTSPAAARAGGLLCAKILLQNFYDPNTAGGCGVAPFPSRIRFRMHSVASSLGRGCTNAKKAAWWRPYVSALVVGCSATSGDAWIFVRQSGDCISLLKRWLYRLFQ